MRIHLSQSPNLKIVDRANGSDGFAVNVSVHRSDARRWTAAGFQRPSTNFSVINLRSYRRQRPPQYFNFSIADLERPQSFCQPSGPTTNAGFDENYLKRMKVNAGVFVFLIFFILSGVWLMDGLKQAFGN